MSRIWPEGYEFPSCKPCNRATKNDELLVDLLARFPTCLDWWRKRRNSPLGSYTCWSSSRTFTGLCQCRSTTDADFDDRIPGRGGAAINLPEEFRYRLNRVAFKLGAALHYKHADQQIIPAGGGCIIYIVPNQDPELNRRADEFLRQLADQRADPVANRRSLGEQFEYDFWSREENAGLNQFVSASTSGSSLA